MKEERKALADGERGNVVMGMCVCGESSFHLSWLVRMKGLRGITTTTAVYGATAISTMCEE